jgi:uncharacterized protein YcbX
MASVTGLFIYPIKSCGAISLQQANCGPSGFRWDREWVLRGSNGKALTQRDVAEMALVSTHVEVGANGDTRLKLSFPDRAPLVVSSSDNANRERMVTDVWGTDTAGYDEGDEAARWLAEALGVEARLVRRDFSEPRLTKIAMPSGEYAPLSYFDSMPLLVTGEESLEDLNEHIKSNGGDEGVPMDRFRGSIVIRGLGAFAEDRAQTLRIGGIEMHRGKPCARCVVTTIDQTTAKHRGPEPLRTLSKYRQVSEKVMFGMYYMPANAGVIAVGDEVEVVA